MKRQELDNTGLGGVDLYVTSSLVLFRRSGFWYDSKIVYQLVPAQRKGFVIVMRHGIPLGEEPLYAWTVYRPTSLVLSWEQQKTVFFHALDWCVASGLQQENEEWFKDVGRKHGTTL